MSFRKRNIGVSRTTDDGDKIETEKSNSDLPSGVRPSYQDSRPTTSTGSASLDEILGGHAGLPLGSSLLMEETGTTDFAFALLRYYAAEGVVQNHHVHLVGVPEQWARDLPGVVDDDDKDRSQLSSSRDSSSEKMRIAWRYERLGDFGTGSRVPTTPNRSPAPSSGDKSRAATPKRFCHSYDLTKRLSIVPSPPLHCVPLPMSTEAFPSTILFALKSDIRATPATSVHRIVIPSLLSPALYPSDACNPALLLPFLHGLRSLLHEFPRQLTAMISLPLSLHPRSTGLVRWVEHLCDGVIELAPFPYRLDIDPPAPPTQHSSAESQRSKAEEKAQGALKVHKTPALTAKGRGSGAGDDMAFSLGRRQLTVMKYHLPPVEGDQDAQQASVGDNQLPKTTIEF